DDLEAIADRKAGLACGEVLVHLLHLGVHVDSGGDSLRQSPRPGGQLPRVADLVRDLVEDLLRDLPELFLGIRGLVGAGQATEDPAYPVERGRAARSGIGTRTA